MSNRLKDEMDIQDAAGRNKYLKWFIENFNLSALAESEKDFWGSGGKDPLNAPVLYTLRSYFLETDKMNEEDDYGEHDLNRILELLSGASGTKTWKFKPVNKGEKYLTMSKVAKIIREQHVDKEEDVVMKNGWVAAIRTNIMDSLKIVSPWGYRNRHNKVYVRNLLKLGGFFVGARDAVRDTIIRGARDAVRDTIIRYIK